MRASRVRKGFKGLWDKLTFKYWAIRKANEKEAWQCHVRDREERQELIEFQLDQRQNLQAQFDSMRKRHGEETQKLMADMARMAMPDREHEATPEMFRGKLKKADLGIEARSPRTAPRNRPKRGRGLNKTGGHEPDA